MKPAFSTLLASIIAAMMPLSGHCGELRISTPVFVPSETKPTIATTAPDLNMEAQGDGIYAFSFKEKTKPFAEIKIRLDNAPAGYRNDIWVYEIPYYWDGSKRRELGAALANDNTSIQNLASFLAAAQAEPRHIPNIVEINQRARTIWAQQYSQILTKPRPPKTDDIKVAYWLLWSSRELVERAWFKLDETTWDAKEWLSAEITLRPSLFNEDTVSVADAERLVTFIDSHESLHIERVVLESSKSIAKARPAGCMVATGLKAYFNGLDSTSLRQIDPSLRYSLETDINVALCRTRELAAIQRKRKKLTRDEIETARELHAQIVATADQAEAEKTVPKLRVRARKHAKELIDKIVYFEQQLENAS